MSTRKPAKAKARRVSAAVPKATDAYHHGDLRRALLDAAWEQVDREGPDAVSLAGLAKQLGVSQPAPYRHFPDRNALLTAVATRAFSEFTASLRQAGDGPAGKALSRMAQAYVDFGTSRRGIYRLMFASPILLDAAGDAELKAIARGSFELLVGALDTQGAARPEARALRIWVALHGIVMLANQGLLQQGVTAAHLPELVQAVLASER